MFLLRSNVTSEGHEDVADIAVGGGEAPACRGEMNSVSLSLKTTPDTEDSSEVSRGICVAKCPGENCWRK